jgi:foldase protein PrsA
MGIMSIRRVAQKLLAPVIIVLVVALMIGMFYIGIPQMGKENFLYQGPSLAVNGQSVNDASFNNYLTKASQQANQYAQYGMNYTEAQVRDTAVSLAIRDLAFEQEMKKAGSKVKVSDAEVDQIIKKYLPTEEELQNAIERQGVANKAEFKKIVSKSLETQKFIQLKARELKIGVSEAEVREQLEQVTVDHILIGLKDPTTNKPLRSDAEALKLANEVYQKASTGGDFAKLAKQYSDDPGSKEQGGKMGPMPVGQFKTGMVKEFVDGAMALKPGEISKPVKTQFGYHVIKLETLGIPSGDDTKEKYTAAENDLLSKKAQESPAFQKWEEKLFQDAEAKTEIKDPGLRAYRLAKSEKWLEATQAYEKALNKSYYKKRWDMWVSAAEAYTKLKQPKKAIELLKKATVGSDMPEFQEAVAVAYQADGQEKKAEELLVKFGSDHPNDAELHKKLKASFEKLKMTDAAAKEDQIIANIDKLEKEKLQQYQENLAKKQSTTPAPGQQTEVNPGASPAPTPKTK